MVEKLIQNDDGSFVDESGRCILKDIVEDKFSLEGDMIPKTRGGIDSYARSVHARFYSEEDEGKRLVFYRWALEKSFAS